MKKKILKAVIIGCGDRGLIYANYMINHEYDIDLVAIAEPQQDRRERIKDLHHLDDSCCFLDYKELFSKGKIADVAIISTQDKLHFEPTMMALQLGYDVLIEKPMSPDISECIQMVEEAKRLGRKLVVCHVLRYSPIFMKVKELINNGEIGKIMSIQHIENVGYWHQAHSFVRGSWRNSDDCCPMIMAKCCHDFDFIQWIVGGQCISISSFGELSYFKEENAPEGSTEYCYENCKARENCPYDALSLYKRFLNRRTEDGKFAWPLSALTAGGTDADVIKAIEKGPYGRCVYRCDNNVVDHQVVNFVYDNGATVSHTMCAFTSKVTRQSKIMGTKGEMYLSTEDNRVLIRKFLSRDVAEYTGAETEGGHDGGDEGLMRDFINYIRDDVKSMSITSAEVSLASHVIALAAEESRLKNKTVDFKEFYQDSLK